MQKHEVYISTDIEADGKIPFRNSMLSIGAAAFTPTNGLAPLSTFSANLELLEGAVADEDTAKWWQSQPQAWTICRENPQPPKQVMLDFNEWVNSLDGIPVFVGYPAGFDFTWTYNYLIKFTDKSPFSFSALDIKTYAMAILGQPYRFCTKRNFPREWFYGVTKHNHCALDDAIGQGQLFMNMLKWHSARLKK